MQVLNTGKLFIFNDLNPSGDFWRCRLITEVPQVL